jgi:ferredoxin
MPTLICDCNRTMPLSAERLGQALNEPLTLHSTLCRREAGAFLQAIQQGDDPVVVACTQEQRLFAALADEAQAERKVPVAPLRFVNIRETGGWSRDAREAGPKIAALLAAARLPEPEPVPTVTYKSAGRVLVIGALDAAERAAALLGDELEVTLFAQGAGAGAPAQERRHAVLGGRIEALQGWLGNFTLTWTASNPIDLDLCTRCNACVAACPEGAIGLDYQIDLARCQSHRACVKACTAAGAIDFGRASEAQSATFDLVLDLRAKPAFTQHAPPQGYFHGLGEGADHLRQLRERVGEFEKPKFFVYKPKLCAHSRNETVGCNACVDICSAKAIGSDRAHQQIKVNPHLCVGCGACTTVCPTGALAFAYPRASEQGLKIRTLLSTYAGAHGRDAVLLLHSQQAGQALVNDLGRAAQLRRAHGVPANVIPMALWHTASLGLDVWLSAVAYGASQVVVLATAEEAPQYLEGLQAQLDVAQALLQGLGYGAGHFSLLHVNDAPALDAALAPLAARRTRVPARAARFALTAEKRSTLELAVDHLVAEASAVPEAPIALPAAAPWGTVTVDKDKCTLCLSCVSACPASALLDNPLQPQLRFIEKNCVQCGLCETTCPEDAIALVPRYAAGAARKEARVLNETPPYACIRCGKPFGTLKAVEAMLGKLAGHAMFQGEALNRLKMCGDCRVIDIYSATDERRITE